LKGNPWGRIQENTGVDVMFSWRRGQSQKPQQIYELIEQLIPNGKV